MGNLTCNELSDQKVANFERVLNFLLILAFFVDIELFIDIDQARDRQILLVSVVLYAY